MGKAKKTPFPIQKEALKYGDKRFTKHPLKRFIK